MTGPAHPEQSENPWAGQGSVVLDIGGAVGALVVTMPRASVGLEVEIQPEGDRGDVTADQHGHGHGHKPHVAVVERPVVGGSVPSLVFPELVEGRYELYEKGTSDVRLTVAVSGGEVATADWPD